MLLSDNYTREVASAPKILQKQDRRMCMIQAYIHTGKDRHIIETEPILMRHWAGASWLDSCPTCFRAAG